MPKYMLIWRTIDEAKQNAAMSAIPFEQMLEKMGRLNDELIKAGVVLAMEGLDPEEHTVVTYADAGEPPVVTDGPYGETGRLEGGGGRVGQAAQLLPRFRRRGPPGAHDRRVSAGQPVDPEGARLADQERSALTAEPTPRPPRGDTDE